MDTQTWVTLIGFAAVIWYLRIIADRLDGIYNDLSAVRTRADEWNADKKLAGMPVVREI